MITWKKTGFLLNRLEPGVRRSDSPLSLPTTLPPCSLALLLHPLPPRILRYGTAPLSWRSSGYTGTSVCEDRLLREDTSLESRKLLRAVVSIFPSSMNCSNPEVRLRSARSPQSVLVRGWQKERGWGPGKAEQLQWRSYGLNFIFLTSANYGY